MKNLIYITTIIILTILPILLSLQVCGADTIDIKGPLANAGSSGGYEVTSIDKTSISQIAGMVVKSFLSLLGVIFIILMLLGGYNLMIAAGDEEKVNKAKHTIHRAIIGLLIIIGAYAIWWFVRTAFWE